MTILFNSVLILGGIILLYKGGDLLVKGACALALRLKIAPIVVGLTVVAFGTSAPELFVSTLSALRGYSGISLGNIVGSNIINIALILGLTACIATTVVSRNIIRRDLPLMFLSYIILSVAVVPFFWENLNPREGIILRIEGLLMLVAISSYVFFLYRSNRKNETETESAEIAEMEDVSDRPLGFLIFLILLGVLALGFGSDILVRGASWMARNIFNASDRFIGVSVVALGTSLPELMTSVIAATKKQMDISVGNIVGSNIFNCLMVLGVTSLIRPLNVPITGFTIDIIAMIGVSLLLFFIVLIRKKLERWSGITFLLCYATYFIYLLQTRTV